MPHPSRVSPRAPARSASAAVVAGEMTPAVRVLGWTVALLVSAALGAGLGRVATAGPPARAALSAGLLLTATLLAAVLILLGSIVEGTGYGLSLGTHWPYTRNIVVLMVRGDPEAAHRLVATLVGVMALALVWLAPSSATFSGLALVVLTALFGVGTLYVLAGRIPAFVHGAHGLLAYGVFLSYLSGLAYPGIAFWTFLRADMALHPILFTIFLGGMTTGQRGLGRAIGAFTAPRGLAQWTTVVHILSALATVGTLGWLLPAYPAAFYLALGQIGIGFLLFHAVNLKPKHPGVLVAFHQTMALLITAAVVWPR